MTATSIGYGIIGCGMMGQEHIRNIKLLGDAHVAAIYEPDTGMMASALALADGAKPAGSITEMLARPDIDCLLIASPNFRHIEHLEQIATTTPLAGVSRKAAVH